MAQPGLGEMSDLSPKSDPKRTLLSPSHLITIYEYTPLATYRAACHRWPGISVTLAAGCASDRGPPALARSIGWSHQQPPRARIARLLPRRLHRGDHDRKQIVVLARSGLATTTAECIVAGKRKIEVVRVRITEAERRALDRQ
jgi:hypothetical protein